MMREKPCEEDPSINMVLRSGANIGGNPQKEHVEGRKRCDTPIKEHDSEPEWGKKMSREAQWSFVEASTLGRMDQTKPRLDPSMITTFLETCMKLLRDNKAIQGLQELITRCVRSSEPQVVQKIGRHALHIGREMRLIKQIDEYEMDQVILDLGSNANVLPKQTWEHMGKPALQWSPIQL